MRGIKSFKLLGGGEQGILINTKEFSSDMEETILYEDDVARSRRNTVPADLIKAIQSLKYYLLQLTGHWIPKYDEFMNDDKTDPVSIGEDAGSAERHFRGLWQRVTVTQAGLSSGSWFIYGMIEVVEGKPLPLNPQPIKADDDVSFYMEVEDRIKDIMKVIGKYFIDTIPASVKMLRKMISKGASQETVKEISSYAKEEVYNRVMDQLYQNGYIGTAELMNENPPESAEVFKSGNIDSDRQLEAEEVQNDPVEKAAKAAVEKQKQKKKEEPVQEVEVFEEAEDWSPEPEKAPDPFGKPVAENGPAEPVPEEAAFSENLGVEDVIDPSVTDTTIGQPEDEMADVDDDEFV